MTVKKKGVTKVRKAIINRIKGNRVKNILSFGFDYSYVDNKHLFTNVSYESISQEYKLYNFSSKYVEIFIDHPIEGTSGFMVPPGEVQEISLSTGSRILCVQGQASFTWSSSDWYEFQNYIVLINGNIKGKVNRPFIGEVLLGEACRNIIKSHSTIHGCVDRYSGDILTGGMYDSYRTSDKVYVEPGRIITCTGILDGTIFPCRVFVFTSSNLLVSSTTETFIELPSDASYIMFSCNLGEYYSRFEEVKYQVEYGISFTEYVEPYLGYKIGFRSEGLDQYVLTETPLDVDEEVYIYKHKAYLAKDNTEVPLVHSELGNIEFFLDTKVEYLTVISPIVDVTVYEDYDGAIFKTPVNLGDKHKIYWDTSSQQYLVDDDKVSVVSNITEKVKLKLPVERGE